LHSSGGLLRKWHLRDFRDHDIEADAFERVDGASSRLVDVAVLIVVRAGVAGPVQKAGGIVQFR
jgi:hypothetical protein